MNKQILQNITSLITLAISGFLYYRYRKMSKSIEELEELTIQHDQVIDELIDDQESMEEPLQKALVMSQLALTKTSDSEISFAPIIEKKKTENNN